MITDLHGCCEVGLRVFRDSERSGASTCTRTWCLRKVASRSPLLFGNERWHGCNFPLPRVVRIVYMPETMFCTVDHSVFHKSCAADKHQQDAPDEQFLPGHFGVRSASGLTIAF